jgi:hypothetical protein
MFFDWTSASIGAEKFSYETQEIFHVCVLVSQPVAHGVPDMAYILQTIGLHFAQNRPEQ